MSQAKSSRSRAATREKDLCQFPYADGRRCRMLRSPNHSCLCVFHARSEAQLLESQTLGAELARTMSGDFLSATDINFAMSRLYAAVAQERIPVRNANALARIGRIMLHTVPVVKQEFPFFYTFEQWNNMLKAARPLSRPAIPSPAATTAPAAPSALNLCRQVDPPSPAPATSAVPVVAAPAPSEAQESKPNTGHGTPHTNAINLLHKTQTGI